MKECGVFEKQYRMPYLAGSRVSCSSPINQSFPGGFTVKNLPAAWEIWVRSLGWEDPLEKGKATHSSILAWRIPWTVVLVVAKSWTQPRDFNQ